ncbi:phage Gp37/Gp68 family protein [Pseudorhodobacter sp.]|uniref:phage Gp37/Gp68 family protein n=1 Tax=Pseudorhodobacter sp. TaxID=1934400 RepID=UPI0026495E32|nr:phage Gp37/Gp68 family protein [Pseudorhodobacter sp.]MDN5786512.1 phage Gp37/Gp68 family protein [Pseudorhodobacter sp.]
MSKTSISWTEQTWNPIVGCSVVSPGCTNCYAMKEAWRFGHNTKLPQYHGLTQTTKGGSVWTGKVALAEKALLAPLRRRKPTMYFVNSMGDLFHENVPDDWIDRVFAVMALCPQHTFQVLTKRSKRMRAYFQKDPFDRVFLAMMEHTSRGYPTVKETMQQLGMTWVQPASRDDWWPLRNVWLGVSAEDQTRADERIPDLLNTPAAIRFVSAEPLLGAIDLRRWLYAMLDHHAAGLSDDPMAAGMLCDAIKAGRASGPMRPALNWIITGGESGPNARPMHPDWARSIRDQCAEAGVAFHFKQWGEWAPDDHFTHFPDKITDRGMHEWFATDGMTVESHSWRYGKARAGRLLDGRTHDAMPEVL